MATKVWKYFCIFEVKTKLKEIFLKMHGHKSKLVWKKSLEPNKKVFEKGRRFWKFKKMGGDEGTILKHEVKAKERRI